MYFFYKEGGIIISRLINRNREDLYNKELVSISNIINESTGISYTEDDYIDNSFIIKFVDDILVKACQSNATDVHIEPMISSIRIRFRIDGELVEMYNIYDKIYQSIVVRIKVLAKMDISEKRFSQDGKIVFNIDSDLVDIRVSTMPTVYGEKIVLRILKKIDLKLEMTDLGLKKDDEEKIKRLISSQGGLILITGPTGSGKTTTLYSFLNYLNSIQKNIVTIEDPVEYMIEGINQININSKIGFNFAECLRSVLRQDPDIIMVGEIRDFETANIAIRAAITGHLVFSTLHTNDAPTAVIRLIEMGIPPYLVATAVKGIISQRLVKKVCLNCKISYNATEVDKNILDMEGDFYLYKGTGCTECRGTGYKDRIGVFEIIELDREHRNFIILNQNVDKFRDLCINKGMETLKNNCRYLVFKGVTTIDQLIKTYMTND